MITRITDTIHATIFGSLVVAAIQGFMGGLMFWFLGLPVPVRGRRDGDLRDDPGRRNLRGVGAGGGLPGQDWRRRQGADPRGVGRVVIALIDNLLYPSSWQAAAFPSIARLLLNPSADSGSSGWQVSCWGR
jgi:hypothetical protein